jgi:radical SAM protein with 4Fe4S-binding SPASM domain
MASEKQVYKKQNSFINIRYRHSVQDVIPRIKKLQDNLDSLTLTPYQNNIVTRAVTDILDSDQETENTFPFTLHSFNISEIEKLTDQELPRFLFYRYRYEVFPQQLQLDEFPPCLQIEPASICNYRCVFCYQVDTSFSKKNNGMMGAMSFDLFKSLIDDAEGNCEAISLASRGEPLICPDIKKMLAYAEGKFLALKLNTNAWFLDEAKCHAILQAGVNTVVFSAESASEPNYSRFRVGGQLERVVKNIKRFHEIREKQYAHSTTISRVSGVKVPGSDDIDHMERFWGDWVDQVSFVDYNPWENTYQQPINNITTACSDLWRRMFVWWDGSVNPCDSDYKSALCVGKASESGLSSLWRSQQYEELRDNHKNQKRQQCNPCDRCSVI